MRDCHFMLQREVVERMAAEPGTAEYGRLSVMLQYRWVVEPLFDVAADGIPSAAQSLVVGRANGAAYASRPTVAER